MIEPYYLLMRGRRMASVEVTSEMQSPEAPILGQDSTLWDYRHTPPSLPTHTVRRTV